MKAHRAFRTARRRMGRADEGAARHHHPGRRAAPSTSCGCWCAGCRTTARWSRCPARAPVAAAMRADGTTVHELISRSNHDLSAVGQAAPADPARPLRPGAHPPLPGLRARPAGRPAGRRAARGRHRALARRRRHRGPAGVRRRPRALPGRRAARPDHDRGVPGGRRPAARLGRAGRADQRDPQRHRRRRVPVRPGAARRGPGSGSGSRRTRWSSAASAGWSRASGSTG